MKIPKKQAELRELLREHRPEKPSRNGRVASPARSDADVIEALEGSEKFDRLWRGDLSDYAGDHSAADNAFVWMLYPYTQDEEQIRRIHGTSALARPKSLDRDGYLQYSLDGARENVTYRHVWSSQYSGGDSTECVTPITSVTPVTSVTRVTPTSIADLMEEELPPLKWIVEGVVPEGVTLLAGKPKKGKSWLALALCHAVAAAGKALGSKDVTPGKTLYLALEDNKRRMQRRMRKMLQDEAAPRDFLYVTEWARLDEGGTEELDAWLEENPDTSLVVIDTLAKVRKWASGKNTYQEDYAALQTLLPLAAKHHIAIVVVHHLRKTEGVDPEDEISGSTGLTGGVDGWMLLRRKPGAVGPTLFVDGRDIEDSTEFALEWNANIAAWSIEGVAAEVHMSETRRRILAVLGDKRMTPKEVSEDLPGLDYNNIKAMMRKMLADDQLTKNDKGEYAKPGNTGTGPPTGVTPDKSDTNGDNPGLGNGGNGGNGTPISDRLPPGESATLEQLKRVAELVRQGMREDLARAEVLGTVAVVTGDKYDGPTRSLDGVCGEWEAHRRPADGGE